MKDALLEMELTQDTMNCQYRKRLMMCMSKANLSETAKFMVLFLFSVVKNKDGNLKSMESQAADDKALEWYDQKRRFIVQHTTQYVIELASTRSSPRSASPPAT